MSSILITGATGNIGSEVIRFITKIDSSNNIVAGVRDIEKAKVFFKDYSNLKYVHFDFEDFDSFDSALDNIEVVFLLRPPHISDVPKFFKPLILKIKEKNINKIVFLSVQGAEQSSIIPHNKIEKLITENGLDYIFIRPSYFMQNLTTTLIADIIAKREIILPAGNAKFNWIDIENIGEVAAILLHKFDHYKNHAIEITGLENENFESVTSKINLAVNNPIKYLNKNPFAFYQLKKREGMDTGLIIVMILLHFLPRFQQQPKISTFYYQLTGKQPTDLKTFIAREKQLFEKR